jgi:hypothetical protein
LAGTNTLAYFVATSFAEKKGFITLTTEEEETAELLEQSTEALESQGPCCYFLLIAGQLYNILRS